MNIQEAEDRYAELAEECKTDEELDEKINSLDEKEIFALAHATLRADVLNTCQFHSNVFLNFLDQNEIIYKQDSSEIDECVILGMLMALANLLNTKADNEARVELQRQNESTQYGLSLANYISDETVVLKRVVEDILVNETYYAAVLKGREQGVHFQDQDGSFIPFTEEEAELLSPVEHKQKKVMLTPEKFEKKEE
jgi:hypothetical protein